MVDLDAIKAECCYSEDGGLDDEGNNLGSVDALIAYKDALEDRLAGDDGLAEQLEGMLWPERFPPGHERHDPDHVYWSGDPEPNECFEWSAGTIESVAATVEQALDIRDVAR